MKLIKCHTVIMAAALTLTTSAAWGEETFSQTNPPVPLDVPLTDQQFVTDAAMAGMVETYISHLALGKSTNANVRNFANRMLKDHAAANRDLQKIAQKKGLIFPPTNTFAPDDPNWANPLVQKPMDVKPAQMLMTTNLDILAGYRAIQFYKTLDVAEFEQAFWQGMANDHRLVVNEFRLATNSLADADLKKFAKKTLPTLQHHLMVAENSGVDTNRMDRSMNTPYAYPP